MSTIPHIASQQSSMSTEDMVCGTNVMGGAEVDGDPVKRGIRSRRSNSVADTDDWKQKEEDSPSSSRRVTFGSVESFDLSAKGKAPSRQRRRSRSPILAGIHNLTDKFRGSHRPSRNESFKENENTKRVPYHSNDSDLCSIHPVSSKIATRARLKLK